MDIRDSFPPVCSRVIRLISHSYLPYLSGFYTSDDGAEGVGAGVGGHPIEVAAPNAPKWGIRSVVDVEWGTLEALKTLNTARYLFQPPIRRRGGGTVHD